MLRRTSSTASVPQPVRQPSYTPSLTTRRRGSGLTTLETGRRDSNNNADETIHEEIDEIKRYEDFTTIDWVQDAAREQLRRKAKQQEKASFFERQGGFGLRRKLLEAYDAAQGWIIVTIIGAAIGVNAAFLNIATEWLSDIKLGHCKTAFYLNEQFCCWGSEGGKGARTRATISRGISLNFCRLRRMASMESSSSDQLCDLCDILCKTLLDLLPSSNLTWEQTVFAFISARLVKAFAPYAAGSGISEIKCIIAGFVMKGFLGFWTLVIKSIGLPLAIGSGLSVGKEGPSVHYAVCTGNVISRLFDKYKRNAAKTREILSACAAAGVAVAFGSPIGGVLFSLEVIAKSVPNTKDFRGS